MGGSNITVNGQSIFGRDLTIKDGIVLVDRNRVNTSGKVINILIEGDANNVQIDACDKIIINGNVAQLSTTSGDVILNQANGDIKTTSGDVTCEGNVGGSINTISGDVKVHEVSGSVKTLSGDIKRIKPPKDGNF